MSVRDYETPTLCIGCKRVLRDPEGCETCKYCDAPICGDCVDEIVGLHYHECESYDQTPIEQERP